MELKKGAVVRAIGPDHEHASKWRVLKLVQATRHRSAYLAHNAHPELEDHQVIVTTCRYDPRLLGNRGYVDNVRRRLLHEAQMLTIPHNVLPEPVDLFLTKNSQDSFSFGEAERYRDTEPVLVTEPYYGTPLDELVTRHGPLDQRRALRIGLKLCDLLEDLHRRNVLVYEFRPEDIMVDTTDDDRLWILGCANIQKMGTAERVRVQDLVVPLSDFTYTAPEVEAGAKPLDRRSDIYSFGALMLYTLTGHKPRQFIGEQGHNEAVYSLRELSPAICQMLGRCLSFDPAVRCSSPKEVRAALREAFAGLDYPYPPPVQQLTAEDADEQPRLSWQLPDPWSDAYGFKVCRWCSADERPPPDVEHWEVLFDRTPCDAFTLTDGTGQHASTTHYAVSVQAPFQDRSLASYPVFTKWRAPLRPLTVTSRVLAVTGRVTQQLFSLLLKVVRRLRAKANRPGQDHGPGRSARGRADPGKVVKKPVKKTTRRTGKAQKVSKRSTAVGGKKGAKTPKAERASPEPSAAQKSVTRPGPASKKAQPKVKPAPRKAQPKAKKKSTGKTSTRRGRKQ